MSTGRNRLDRPVVRVRLLVLVEGATFADSLCAPPPSQHTSLPAVYHVHDVL
jgi:hypothetical protein